MTLIDSPLNDIWIRDTGPTFVLNGKSELGAVDLNFNDWGEKQDFEQDATVAEFVASKSNAKHHVADIVGEGCGIEVDGAGTAIVTESCFFLRRCKLLSYVEGGVTAPIVRQNQFATLVPQEFAIKGLADLPNQFRYRFALVVQRHNHRDIHDRSHPK